MNPLVASLKVLQAQERLTAGAMAARLCVSEPHWSRLCSEERRLSLDTLRRVLLLWPDLERQVIEYLKNGG